MNSVLSITTPAADLALLSVEELRAAAGVADDSQDSALARLGARAAARIAAVCNIATGGITPPTLRKETLTETFRSRYRWPGSGYSMQSRHRGEDMILARRPIISVASITEDDVALDPANYELLSSAGMLRRLTTGGAVPVPGWWFAAETIVVYDAGWDTVPDDLKRAAEILVRSYRFEGSRDPAVRQINIPGVVERQFFSSPQGAPDIPQEVMDILGPYRNIQV